MENKLKSKKKIKERKYPMNLSLEWFGMKEWEMKKKYEKITKSFG